MPDKTADDMMQYVSKYETWWGSKFDCPECGQSAQTNGTIRKCNDCQWWELIE